MTATSRKEAEAIADRWVARIGFGFHPDTRGDDYCRPRFSKKTVAEYEADMDRLFGLDVDPYEIAVEAMKNWEAGHK